MARAETVAMEAVLSTRAGVKRILNVNYSLVLVWSVAVLFSVSGVGGEERSPPRKFYTWGKNGILGNRI